MATTKFYLDMRGKAKDGKGSIVITLYHNFSTASFSTGIRVAPNEWTGDKIVRVPGSEALNARLNEQKGKIDKQIAILSIDDDFSRKTASEIKQEISSWKNRNSREHNIEDLFRDYCSSNLKEGTKDIYRATLKKIIAFAGPGFKIEKINLKWLRDFDAFLSKTQSINGKSIYLRSLRAICKYACHIGIDIKYPFFNFQIKSEPTIKRSIPAEKLRELMSIKVDSRTRMYRDYFFLMFYLIGINAKDLLLAKKSQVIDGRLEYIREKTGKKYSIKIEPEAMEIIKRYEGKGDYLLDAMDHCKYYKSFFRQINESLQKVGTYTEELVPEENSLFTEYKVKKTLHPIIPNITTYYARHSWATIAYCIGIQLDVISQALGHSSGNRTTLIYIKHDRSKVDLANRKVIDYLTR